MYLSFSALEICGFGMIASWLPLENKKYPHEQILQNDTKVSSLPYPITWKFAMEKVYTEFLKHQNYIHTHQNFYNIWEGR